MVSRIAAVAAGILVTLLLLVVFAGAKDDGRYAQNPLKQWFDQLRSSKGFCCSDADGEETEFDIRSGAYWAPIDGVWTRVPDEVVITEPNKLGRPMKWLYMENGQRVFRCFMPGSGA